MHRRLKLSSTLALALSLAAAFTAADRHKQPSHRDDIVIADFEGPDYAGWIATGNAFGSHPARKPEGGELLHTAVAGQQPRPITGYTGKGLAASIFNGSKNAPNAAKGTLTSPLFEIRRDYINLLVGGGFYIERTIYCGETHVDLLVGGEVVAREAGIGDPGDALEPLRLDWVTWDVRKHRGKTAQIRIVDDADNCAFGFIMVDQVVQSDERKAAPLRLEPLNETHRPQFHFTALKGWLQDPCGLVYYKGVFHLFHSYYPDSVLWGPREWGHAISTDLVHWKHLPSAIKPETKDEPQKRDDINVMSGSTTVDWRNDSGLQRGEDAVLLAFYTYHGLPRGQYMAYSNDRGMTWTKYEGNPVLPGPGIADRDPKVFPFGGKWFMLVSYAWGPDVSRERFADHLYSSSDLKSWRHMGEVKDSVNFAECPDFFELPVDGDKTRRKWVLVSGNGKYIIGTFDGERFAKESGPHTGDYGNNFYATQTWDDGARRIQIAWMARDGRYPRMPFNQQMSFPCSLTLRTTANGVRMFRYPVEEIRTIRGKERRWTSTELVPGRNLLEGAPGELVDIEAEFEPNDAKEITFVIRGAPVTYRVPDGKLVCRSREAPLERVGNRIKLRILADRTSIEVFGNDGLVSMTNFFLPTPEDRELRLTSKGGLVKVILLKVRELRSAWGTQ